MHWPRAQLIILVIISTPAGAQKEEFTFDVEAFEPRTFEFTGYVEGEPEHARANQDGALYQLQFFGIDPEKRRRR